MTQLGKCLPYKYEELSSDVSTCVKGQALCHTNLIPMAVETGGPQGLLCSHL